MDGDVMNNLYGFKIIRPENMARVVIADPQPSRIVIIYRKCVDLLRKCVLPYQGIMNLTKMIVRIIRA